MGVFGATRGRTSAQPPKAWKANGSPHPPICLEPPLVLRLLHVTDNQRLLFPRAWCCCTGRLTLLTSRQKVSVAKLEFNQPWFGRVLSQYGCRHQPLGMTGSSQAKDIEEEISG